MRWTVLATAALVVAGIATSASAQERRQGQTQARPSYDTCEILAIQRGAGPGRGGGTNADAQHAAFMKQCLAGNIPE